MQIRESIHQSSSRAHTRQYGRLDTHLLLRCEAEHLFRVHDDYVQTERCLFDIQFSDFDLWSAPRKKERRSTVYSRYTKAGSAALLETKSGE